MNRLLRRHTIHNGFAFIAAAAVVSPPVATLEVLSLIAFASGDPLVWFEPESQDFLRFAAMIYLAGGFAVATITALLLLWWRRPSLVEAQALAAVLCATGLFLVEPARLTDSPSQVALRIGVVALIVVPATLCAGWVAALWGAFNPGKSDPAPD